MTEKRQTSQGYIIRILQHFATKLWNITNFVMLFQLFQAVMKFLSRLVLKDQNLVYYNANGPLAVGDTVLYLNVLSPERNLALPF